MNLVSAKVGMHAWSYSNDYSSATRSKMQHAELAERFAELETSRSSSASPPSRRRREVERCLNCDIQTHFTANLCIECDACVDVCPVNCLTITPNGSDEADLRTRLSAPALNLAAGDLRLRRASADEARHGEGRRRLSALRPVRRALPDRGVGHEAVRPADSVRGAECEHEVRDSSPQTGAEAMPSAAPASADHGVDQRLRLQDRHGQRHRFGEREQPAHAGHLPHGNSGVGEERLSVEHPGAAHLVRDPGQQGRLHGAPGAKSTWSSR